MKMKEKEKMFREKIERLIEIIAKKKRWDCYEILNLDVILDDGKFAEADITVFYSDENDFDEVLKSKFNKITQKNLLRNAVIY